MSILLESLNKDESPNQERKLPDVHASHFDDDMLGDEWLIRRIKVWQIACVVLLIGFIASWIMLYPQIDQAQTAADKLIVENQELKQQLNEALKTNNLLLEKSSRTESKPATQVTTSTPIPQQSIVSSEQKGAEVSSNISKQQYVPKKRPKESPAPRINNQAVTSQKVSPQTVANNTAQGSILNKEELSADLLSQFPNIEINSFVVADNPEDSFVILDGSFYKVNQVIAPNLILREIAKQYILVEFHTQLVKLPND